MKDNYTVEFAESFEYGFDILILIIKKNGEKKTEIKINPELLELAHTIPKTAFVTGFDNLSLDQQARIFNFVSAVHSEKDEKDSE